MNAAKPPCKLKVAIIHERTWQQLHLDGKKCSKLAKSGTTTRLREKFWTNTRASWKKPTKAKGKDTYTSGQDHEYYHKLSTAEQYKWKHIYITSHVRIRHEFQNMSAIFETMSFNISYFVVSIDSSIIRRFDLWRSIMWRHRFDFNVWCCVPIGCTVLLHHSSQAYFISVPVDSISSHENFLGPPGIQTHRVHQERGKLA